MAKIGGIQSVIAPGPYCSAIHGSGLSRVCCTGIKGAYGRMEYPFAKANGGVTVDLSGLRVCSFSTATYIARNVSEVKWLSFCKRALANADSNSAVFLGKSKHTTRSETNQSNDFTCVS